MLICLIVALFFQFGFTYMTYTQSMSLGSNYAISSVNSGVSHFGVLYCQIGQAPLLYIYQATPLALTPSSLSSTTCDLTARIRTSPNNTSTNLSTNTYLYFTTTSYHIYQSSTNTIITLLNLNSSITIHDACFGQNQLISFVLVLETNVPAYGGLSRYCVFVYNGTGLLGKSYVEGVDPDVSGVDRISYNAYRLIIVFTSKIEIYGVINSTNLSLMFGYSFANTLPQYLDAHLQAQLLIFSRNNAIIFYNLSSQLYISYQALPTPIYSLAKSPTHPYIFIRSQSMILQYDYQINIYLQNISSLATLPPEEIAILDGDQFVGFTDNKTNFGLSVNLYSWTGVHCFGCPGCPSTYFMNNSACEKNMTEAVNDSLFVRLVSQPTLTGITTDVFVPVGTINLLNLPTPVSSTTPNPPPKSLIQSFNPFPTNFSLLLTTLPLSFPVSRLLSLRYLYLSTSDFWLYNYDNRTYEGALREAFDVITLFSVMRFEIFQRVIGVGRYVGLLPVSDYQNYTMERFISVEGTSAALIVSNFSFFVYTIPQNITICLFLFFLFTISKNLSIGRYFRSFYFFKWVLIQAFMDGNVSYFTYICFSHLSFPFSFMFGDKLSLLFTIIFFFGLIIYGICFFFLVDVFIGKNSCHFIYSFYRFFPSYCALTVKYSMRGLLRGVFHFFLHYYYGAQIACLSIVELLVIIIIIFFEKFQKVYIISTIFCRQLVYHFAFIIFNLVLYIDYINPDTNKDNLEIRELIFAAEEALLYINIFLILFTMIIDLVPFKWMKPTSQSIQQTQTNIINQETGPSPLTIQNIKTKKQILTTKICLFSDNNGLPYIRSAIKNKKNKRYPHDQETITKLKALRPTIEDQHTQNQRKK